MLKITICLLFFISLFIFYQEMCVQATKNYPLRKFGINFKEAGVLKEKVLQIQKDLILRRKEEEDRRREEEERKRKEEEKKMDDLRRKVFHEYLLNQITGKSTVLKDLYSRF
jgi:hypothetical protein